MPRPIPPLSGWWRRVFASLVDTVIATLIAGPVTVALGIALVGATDSWSESDEEIGDLFVYAWIPVWIAWLLIYYPLTMRRAGAHNGQTWGKQLARIRVVRQDGRAFDARAAIVREVVVKNLLFATLGSCACLIPYLMDVFWPLWDDQKQALHDKMVDTFVVRYWGDSRTPRCATVRP